MAIVLKLVNNKISFKDSTLHVVFCVVWSLLFCSACSSNDDLRKEVDELNDKSYAHRYRNVDSTRIYSVSAFQKAESCGYHDGMAQALQNQSFYFMARMNYHAMDSVLQIADSLAEDDETKLINAISRMKYCQRRSLNKEFYNCKYDADNLLDKYRNKTSSLNHREQKRYTYAKSEYGIVLSTYLYYVNHIQESSQALLEMFADKEVALYRDTAQYLAYLYNVGAGGILQETNKNELLCKEFDYLMQCYVISRKNGYVYWEANALQSLSEHIASKEDLAIIKERDAASLRYLNEDEVPDSLLAGNLAARALQSFVRYGDLYQIAGSWRTMSYCYQQVGDYEASLSCLLNAISDSMVSQSPDLLASLYEKLSLTYSALDNKQMSDYNRNLYLDIQDSTRQDRQLEARAESLKQMVEHSNMLLKSVCVLLLVFTFLTLYLIYYRKRHGIGTADNSNSNERISKWREDNQSLHKEHEEIEEQQDENLQMAALREDKALRINIEQHARISFVQSLLPLIDRMLRTTKHKDAMHNSEILNYVSDVCNTIVSYNDILTSWIQLKKGQITVNVESVPVKEVFDVISLGRTNFDSTGKILDIAETECVIKADRILTIFIINTIVDNAKKHIPQGGKVSLFTQQNQEDTNYVDIIVEDNGTGMEEEKLLHLFDDKQITQQNANASVKQSHGFALANCKGIIDRYKKISDQFSHCEITADSKQGKGTKITVTLPSAIRSILLAVILTFTSLLNISAHDNILSQYADSVFNANVEGNYSKALRYADSCISTMNASISPHRNDMMTLWGNGNEMKLRADSVKLDYDLLLWLRNEIAIAALALHEWDLYESNNKIYTRLYKEMSKDTTLDTYCEEMEHSRFLNRIYMSLLVVLFLGLVAVLWFFYLKDIVNRKTSKRKYYRILNQLSCSNEEETRLQLLALQKTIKDQHLNDSINGIIEEIDKYISEKQKHDEYVFEKNQSINVSKHRYNRYHIANNIIDNALSSLKHETMYFPSHIAMLVKRIANEQDNANKEALYAEMCDTINYYRELYVLLSAKLNDAGSSKYKLDTISLADKYGLDDLSILINRHLLDYLNFLLKNKNNKVRPDVSIESANDTYITLRYKCGEISMSDKEASRLFAHETTHVDWLIIRQIIRETGSSANAFACGVKAIAESEGLDIIITYPRSKS